MRLLLDTHVFLWWRIDAPELSAAARSALMDADNEIFVSTAVAWEIVVKRGLGKLEFDGTVEAAIADEGFTPLAVRIAHVDRVAMLPDRHRDPFDRLLIAQAQVEAMTLVTADALIRRYDGFSLLAV